MEDKRRLSLKLSVGSKSPKKARFLLVGGGVSAAWFAYTYIASGGKGSDLALVTLEGCLPYYKCSLVDRVLRGTRKIEDLTIFSEQWFSENEIAVHLSSAVTGFNPAKRAVTTASGQAFSYSDALLICTGCRSLQAAVPGHDLTGVHYVYDSDHAAALKADLADPKTAVVIGDCYRAMSCAMTLVKLGHTVTLAMEEDHLMPRAFPSDLAAMFERYLESNGVHIERDRKCVAFLGRNAALRGCKFNSGEVVDCDLAVVFFDTVPNTEPFVDHLATQKGAKFPGLLVDNYFRTNLPGVYALGAVASLPFSQSGSATLAQADFAKQSGCYLARCLANPTTLAPFIYKPHFGASVLDVKYLLVGDPVGGKVATFGEFGEELVCVWMEEEVVVGAFLSGASAKAEDRVVALVRAGSKVDRAGVDTAKSLPDLYKALGVSA